MVAVGLETSPRWRRRGDHVARWHGGRWQQPAPPPRSESPRQRAAARGPGRPRPWAPQSRAAPQRAAASRPVAPPGAVGAAAASGPRSPCPLARHR
ncbi:MAG: hypothetical protein MZV63_09760 [Marinilabiliales bacterium]|nr:hypothetical protein [Marinilabiliales bacterium]